jgi:hypothetical protein
MLRGRARDRFAEEATLVVTGDDDREAHLSPQERVSDTRDGSTGLESVFESPEASPPAAVSTRAHLLLSRASKETRH